MSATTPLTGDRQPGQVSTQLSKTREPNSRRSINLQARAESSEVESNQSPQPTTPPRTPRRVDRHSASAGGKKGNSAVPGDGLKQNSRQRRAQNDFVSPSVPIGRQATPTLTGTQSIGIPPSPGTTAPPTVAYAGPTFHASPAPSALPIPSFYSKSVPVSEDIRATSCTAKESRESSTPPSVLTRSHQFGGLESPLDVFFKADREEKARARSASSAYTQVNVSESFHSPTESSLTELDSLGASRRGYAHQGYDSKSSAGGIFAMELERTPISTTLYGPAFSTPYSERINAAKLSRSSPHPSEHVPSASKTPLDRSEALKAYLFSNGSPKPSEAPTAPGHSLVNSKWAAPPSQIVSPANPSLSASRPETGGFNSRPQIQNPTSRPSQKPMSFTIGSQRSGYLSSLRKEVAPMDTASKTQILNQSNAASSSTTELRAGTRESASPVPPYGTAVSDTFAGRTQKADLQDMEDTLRKILKLEVASTP